MHGLPTRSILLLALIASSAPAQSIGKIAREDDSIPGVGLVDGHVRLGINDVGTWFTHLDTDNVTATFDEVLVKTGVVLQTEGGAAPAPAGATIFDWTSLHMRANGDIVSCLSLANTPGGTTDNAGVFINNQLVLQKGATPLSGVWGAGSVYQSFSWANINSANQVLLRGIVNDPTTAPVSDWFAAILQFDGSNVLVSETVIARAGEILPNAGGFGVNTVGSGQDLGSIGATGQAIFRVSLSGAPAGADAAVYTWDGIANTQRALEGSPSPVAGRNWGDLVAPELTMNDAGDWCIKDLLDSTSTTTQEIIVKNGVKFRQEGDNIAAIGAFTFTTFGNTPVSLTAAGDVCWYGDWNDPNTAIDTGIFVNDTLVIQKGVTTVNGNVLNALGNMGTSATAAQNGSFYISPNGRFIVFTGQLATGALLGVFVLDRNSGVVSYCHGDGTGTICPCSPVPEPHGAAGNGCPSSINPLGANLATSGSVSQIRANLVLLGTGMPDSSALYFQGTAQQNGGLGAVFGDGLRCVAGAVIRLGIKFNTGGASQYPAVGDMSIAERGMIPAGGGVTRNYQCWYRNAAAYCNPETFNLTNGVRVIWGL